MCIYIVDLCWWKYGINRTDDLQVDVLFWGCALLIDPILAFSNGYSSIAQAFVSADRIYKVLDQPTVITDHEHSKTHSIVGHVRFENVSFQYNTKTAKVLDNINLTVEPGEMIAVVGLSGGGKSTLIDLIPRFYDVCEGAIYIDDINVKDFKLNNLRSQLAMVFR